MTATPVTSPFPLDSAGRARQRAEIRARLLAQAERDIAQNSRSMKCSGWGGAHWPQHADVEGGCRNDGSTCICECHDRETGATS
ncbi:hypothetical protein [Micromonospora sp. NPDC049891]|uniref:hypothetical protein n=1 Tax=Micromonospora sp. NPDC049891 TaxID=3155655 RepID=UPI0033D87BFF